MGTLVPVSSFFVLSNNRGFLELVTWLPRIRITFPSPSCDLTMKLTSILFGPALYQYLFHHFEKILPVTAVLPVNLHPQNSTSASVCIWGVVVKGIPHIAPDVTALPRLLVELCLSIHTLK